MNHNHITIEERGGDAILNITRYDRIKHEHIAQARRMARLRSFWLWFSSLCVFYTLVSLAQRVI